MLPEKTTVLIIDDVEQDRETYRRWLEDSAFPYEVHEAVDGQSGLRFAETLNPDCILLAALSLRGQSGYELLQELAGKRPPPKRTVIVLTVLKLKPLEEGSLYFGASGFLVKSETDAAALDLAIRHALDKKIRPKAAA